MALLEVKDLYVNYNTDEGVVHALNGLNFSIEKGECIGLVGETGAGKTTLALSITQLLPKHVGEIVQGSIVYDGNDVLAMNKREIQAYR